MPDRLRTFQEVLKDAINDLLANGFDSVERVAKWTRMLRDAAERSLVPEAVIEQRLREGLTAIYSRMVDRGGVARFTPGVGRYTIDKLRPAMRAELDRRIMASAELIKLNRRQAIDKTLQRFSGWSTSIPQGGVSSESRPKVRRDVRKSLRQLPFEERRVLIDQGHKLTAAISEVVASDGGAIALRWRSHWRQPGYDYREDHKDRDGLVYLLRGSWAERAGLVRKGSAGYYDDVTAVAQEPFCRCWAVYVFAVSELPADMLTQKGRRALTAVGQMDVNSAFARADSDGAQPCSPNMGIRQLQGGESLILRRLFSRADAEKATKTAARYVGAGVDRPEGQSCERCSMFVLPGSCTAVEGDVVPAGWCRFFEPVQLGGKTIPIDRSHDVAWMAVAAADGSRVYVDRTLPVTLTLKGRTFDPAELLAAHELGELIAIWRLLADFLEDHRRQPTDAERAAMYETAHHKYGIPAERAAARGFRVDWSAWEAWSRGELARLEHRTIANPPPDPHVKPLPRDRKEPMEAVA